MSTKLKPIYKCLANIGAAAAGERYEHIWTERTPNGDVGLRSVNGTGDLRIPNVLFRDPRYFEKVGPVDEKSPKVKLVLAEAHRVQAGDKLVVTIDPQYTDFIDGIHDALADLGVEAVVLPIPKDSIQFFAIEEKIEIAMDPALQVLANPEAQPHA